MGKSAMISRGDAPLTPVLEEDGEPGPCLRWGEASLKVIEPGAVRSPVAVASGLRVRASEELAANDMSVREAAKLAGRTTKEAASVVAQRLTALVASERNEG